MNLTEALAALACLRPGGNTDVLLSVHVTPNAAKTAVDGLYGEPDKQALKLRLKAPPLEGQANQALVKWLAQTLGVPASSVELVRGRASRHKQLKITADAAARADWQGLLARLKDR